MKKPYAECNRITCNYDCAHCYVIKRYKILTWAKPKPPFVVK